MQVPVDYDIIHYLICICQKHKYLKKETENKNAFLIYDLLRSKLNRQFFRPRTPIREDFYSITHPHLFNILVN